MLPRLEETSALFTLVAAWRPLKHHLWSLNPRQEEQPHTGQALDLLVLSTTTQPLVIHQGRGCLKHRGAGEVLCSSKEGGYLQAANASSREESVLTLAEDE